MEKTSLESQKYLETLCLPQWLEAQRSAAGQDLSMRDELSLLLYFLEMKSATAIC